MVTTSKLKEWYLSREEENIVRNWKKRKLKTKRLLKIIILDESEPSVQSADRTKAVHVWSWGSMYSPKPGNWQQLGSENKYIASSEGFSLAWILTVDSMLERIPLKQQYLKVVKLRSYMKQ